MIRETGMKIEIVSGKAMLADPLVGEVLALWNEDLGEGFPLDERLYRQQLGLEKDEMALFAARKDGRLAGAALVKRRRRPDPDGSVPAVGNLSFIVVNKSSRRRGLGSALLSEAEAWLRGRGAKVMNLGRDRYHFFPGMPLGIDSGAIEAFLVARGFALANEESDLIADLRELDLPALAAASPMAEGYRFALYRPELKPSMVAFFRRNFPGRWLDDTLEALDAGMRPEDLALLVEEGSGEVVGFSRIYEATSAVLGPGVYWRGLMGEAPGGLGPIGVDEGKRGLGLGLALLRASIEELAGRGVGLMAIDWTDLAAFYGKMGFKIWKTYRMASKELS